MPNDPIAQLSARLNCLNKSQKIGRIGSISGGIVTVSGQVDVAVGDRVELGSGIGGEVLGLAPDGILVLPDGVPDGLALGQVVRFLGRVGISPDDTWLGRVVDAFGKPLDGRALAAGPVERRLRSAPPLATSRRPLGPRLETGMAALNTMLPLVRGQRIGLFAGSGVGKSTLLANLARGVSADMTVIALIGERGREVKHFVDEVLGADGMARSVVVAATSDKSALERRRAAWASMAVAEHFRDQGKHVLYLADSVTRFAEAHREVALSGGESAALRGFPPSTTQTIMSLAERAGPGASGQGDITAVFSVLVAGSDMEEPVADILRGVLDGHIILDREIAERGRYPAIDLLRSVSRSLPAAASFDENQLIAEARRLLGAYDRAEMMIQAGLYTAGTDPAIDAAIRVWPALDRFLGETETESTTHSFARLAECLSPKSIAPRKTAAA
ncbi:ATP synthase [Actibacterium mucosum KCTC 23349]|uniref:ATP synthase n=1 Tax=Actibacterium mucosum KCTC 23349 TaxID=1454373 RepID=A0A037ZNW2_9RHOB|nr:FliI/YscN family ATPase [Actibacterium mucosum]KAJ57350.1 ATP synthase [Actibacterium mucosum KCTC 23349]